MSGFAWQTGCAGTGRRASRKAFPGTIEEFHAFLNWVVGDWQNITEGWGARNRPGLPVVGYVLAARCRFFDMWNTAKVERFANDRTNDSIERLRRPSC